MKNVIKITLIFISVIGVINVFSPNCKCEETGTNILYVGGSGNGNYSSIQDAVDNSSDGDTIFVYAGTYNETILINKSINLFGENKFTTIINSNNDFNVIAILDYWINISGFTIQNGPFFGILIDSIGYCNIYQNNIISNRVGISITGSIYSNIFNNTFSNNSEMGLDIDSSSDDLFGPIDLLKSENNTIFFNNFINNTQHTNDGSINFWSYKSRGNYYDDYTGLDKNNDGIGDDPYEIPGGDNVDKYPLMMPYDGEIKSKELIIDYDLVFTMLVVGIIVSIIFVLPIALWWRKKYFL